MVLYLVIQLVWLEILIRILDELESYYGRFDSALLRELDVRSA